MAQDGGSFLHWVNHQFEKATGVACQGVSVEVSVMLEPLSIVIVLVSWARVRMGRMSKRLSNVIWNIGFILDGFRKVHGWRGRLPRKYRVTEKGHVYSCFLLFETLLSYFCGR
tara:strand:+ start:56 stop:394 length:339 start_codon:yes stop_codon:yes gene_type:complete